MDTEVWFRNPTHYIKECYELGVENIVWDYGLVKKRSIDVNRFMDAYYGKTRNWRSVLISEIGAPLLDEDHTLENPAAVFPVWSFTQPWDELVTMIENPVGLDGRACADETVPKSFRPVLGQAHRIMITDTPSSITAMGKKFYHELSLLQEEHPDVILHVHGSYSFRVIFGLPFRSVDFEPRTSAAKSKVVLPNGKIVPVDETEDWDHWVELLGMSAIDLKVPRNRCIYNMMATMWAAKNFRDNVRFQTKGFQHLDPNDVTKFADKSKKKRTFLKQVIPLPDDKFFCNTCSLQTSCKYFRVGAVCAVPDSEPADLAKFFGTRDSSSITQGLATLLQMEATRLGDARQAETSKNEINPEVTKMFDMLFKHGSKLAMMMDPSLRGPVAQGNTTNNTLVLASTPQELAAQVTKYLVANGVPVGEITADMVMAIVEAPGDNLEQKVLSAAAVARTE